MPDNNKCRCGNVRVKGKEFCLACLIRQFNTGQRKPPTHVEEEIQQAFFTLVALELPKLDKLLFAVPNGGKRNAREAARLKRQGVKKGIADIICLVPNATYTCLCMECKRNEGEQSPEQIEFEKQVTAAGGVYRVFRSCEEGYRILKDYLKDTAYV